MKAANKTFAGVIWPEQLLLFSNLGFDRPRNNKRRHIVAERFVRRIILEKAGDHKPGVELPANLILQGMPELQRLFLVDVSLPFLFG
jgi:hypothetical protein